MIDLKSHRLLHYAFMKFARDFDTRYTMLLKTGRLAKWYSQIGSEATTVAAGLALEKGDVLCTLHRDLGAILAYYLDPARAFPGFGFGEPDGIRPDPDEVLYRLACQLLGRAGRFLQRRRAILPLRLFRSRPRHPPHRHDQPFGIHDPRGRRSRLRPQTEWHRPGSDQLHRRWRHLHR